VKSYCIPMALLVAGTLSAQQKTNDLSARVILFGETTQTSGVQLGPGAKDQANYQTGPGIRLMGQLDSDSRWNWELAGRFSSSAHMVTDRDISLAPPVNVLNATQTKINYSYWSVGAGYLLPLGAAADFGMHVEGRNETINPKGTYSTTEGGTGYIDAHTAYFRPWVRLSLDFKARTGSVTTVFGADAGAALIKTTQKAIVPMSQLDDHTLRAMAPTWSGALYAGLQF
jgi:hypothetical protein